jgi:hypothetical protein
MNVGGSNSTKSRDINLNIPARSQQEDGQVDGDGQEVGQGQEQSKVVSPPGRKKSKEKRKKREGDDEYMGTITGGEGGFGSGL